MASMQSSIAQYISSLILNPNELNNGTIEILITTTPQFSYKNNSCKKQMKEKNVAFSSYSK